MLLAKTLRSQTFKLALLAIAAFGSLLIGLLGYVYCSTASYLRGQADEEIIAELTSLERVYASAGGGGLIAMIRQRIAEDRHGAGTYLLAAQSFELRAGNLGGWPKAATGATGWDDLKADDGRLNLRVAFETLADGSHLLVGKDMSALDEVARRIDIAVALSLFLIFALAGMASVLVTRRTVGRIEAINATSRAIMQTGLGQRIPLRGSHDEWDELATNLNSMLDRIETLMREVKQVTDNVAHDLRTPLARIRGRLEKACNRQKGEGNDQALIGDTLAELDAILRMFSALMRISQIEAQDRTNGFRHINLSEIASEVVELFDAAAEETGVQLTIAGSQSVLIRGDRDLLFEAMANLVDNAIKHGRHPGQVTVEVKESGGNAVISVGDNGPGIPANEYAQVFKRFYRLERSRLTSGNGLGLSLVAAVAHLHGARIEIGDNAPGLKIELRFSSPPSDARADSKRAQPLV